MDWRVFMTTFATIFPAEMGDKTQLAAMTMAAETKRPLTVFVSAALALVCVSAVGVAVGGAPDADEIEARALPGRGGGEYL
ncbi:MAG TPA: TMEM165/GDT1 family protein [Pyrinomonadaceae bacterium]|jgi:putative Ca2+/H+ antiporter (TMEM165/GDT1 family)